MGSLAICLDSATVNHRVRAPSLPGVPRGLGATLSAKAFLSRSAPGMRTWSKKSGLGVSPTKKGSREQLSWCGG
eukprot:5080095-Pyramimonas_sp.AAC.1